MPNDVHGVTYAKLKAHYGGNLSLNDYLAKFKKDNPTFGHQLGSPAFYGKTVNETWNDAMARFWNNYVP